MARLGKPPVASRSAASAEWSNLFDKLASFVSLEAGWDSYDATPPAHGILTAATGFLDLLRTNRTIPKRVSPSVVGGVMFAFQNGERAVHVEFRNTPLRPRDSLSQRNLVSVTDAKNKVIRIG